LKKYVLLFRFISIILLFFLIGCTEKQTTVDEESDNNADNVNGDITDNIIERFYGTWFEEVENDGVTMTIRHIFSEDGIYNFEILNIGLLNNGTWSVEEDKISTITSHVNIYSYVFSDNYKTLTLTDITTKEKSILKKQ